MFREGEPPEANDPRLAIPEVLRREVRVNAPTADPESAGRTARGAGGGGMAEAGRAWGVAMEFVVTILVGGGIGWAVDTYWLKGSKAGVLSGLAIGFVVAFVRIVRHTRAQERKDQAARQSGGGRKG